MAGFHVLVFPFESCADVNVWKKRGRCVTPTTESGVKKEKWKFDHISLRVREGSTYNQR